MDTKYTRVIPRDLFNEAKLLKCIGRLVLLIQDGMGNDITFEHDDEAFKIGLLDDGYLAVQNIQFSIGETPLFVKSQYNAKSSFPLYAEYEYCDTLVFDEAGSFTPEFTELCETLKNVEV